MSTQTPTIDAQSVADYLRRHPDFFEQHAWLLPEMRLPHESGAAVSLVERQVAMLRAQGEKCRTQLEELLDVARENDRLNGQLHQLTLLLMECEGLEATMSLLLSRLRRDYTADIVRLHLFARPRDEALAGHSAFVGDAAPLRETFEHLLSSGRPFCGRLKEAQRRVLFDERADQVGSAVVLPLGREGRLGLLAIGSADAGRFSPGGDTTFLGRMAQVIAAALACHLSTGDD